MSQPDYLANQDIASIRRADQERADLLTDLPQPISYETARLKFEAAHLQVDESRADYESACLVDGPHSYVGIFTAAVICAEALKLENECRAAMEEAELESMRREMSVEEMLRSAG
jgi:hypothetical protein